jgi:hypothetical protein
MLTRQNWNGNVDLTYPESMTSSSTRLGPRLDANHADHEPRRLPGPGFERPSLIAYNPNLWLRNVIDQVSNRQVTSTLLAVLGLPLAQLDGWGLGMSALLP